MDDSLKAKEKRAIEVLRSFEPQNEPYYLCHSGGKDSTVIDTLAELAGVKYEKHHHLTTVDTPETVAFIKTIPDIIIDKAHYSDGTHKTMWNLIVKKKMPPTRIMRYCCEQLKESGGQGRLKITGVRKVESIPRAERTGLVSIIGKPKTMQKYLEENNVEYKVNKQGGIILNMDNAEERRTVEHCFRTTSTMVNPILEWSDNDVWDFLKYYNCNVNPQYENGCNRIGCVGCPLASKQNRKRELALYPKYRDNYIRAFNKMIKEQAKKGYTGDWRNGIDVLKWWVEDDVNQLTFEIPDYLKDIPDELYKEIK